MGGGEEALGGKTKSKRKTKSRRRRRRNAELGDALQDTSSVGYGGCSGFLRRRRKAVEAEKKAFKHWKTKIINADKKCQTSQNVLMIDPVVRDALAELRFDIAKEL